MHATPSRLNASHVLVEDVDGRLRHRLAEGEVEVGGVGDLRAAAHLEPVLAEEHEHRKLVVSLLGKDLSNVLTCDR